MVMFEVEREKINYFSYFSTTLTNAKLRICFLKLRHRDMEMNKLIGITACNVYEYQRVSESAVISDWLANNGCT